MKHLFFICFLAVAVQSVYCQQQATLTQSQRAAIRDSVTQLKYRVWDEVRAKHFEGTLNCFDDSPEFFWVFTPDTTIILHDVFVAMLKGAFQDYRSIDVVWDRIHVEPLTNQYAVYTGKYHVTYIDTSGKVFKAIGVETGIVVHRPTGWKILNGQTFEARLKNE